VRLGEQLIAEGAVAPALVDAAVKRMAATGERIGSALIAVGASADRVAMALAGQKRVLAARDAHLAAAAAVRGRLPEDVARRLMAVPVRIAPGTGELVVALRDPDDGAALAELARVSGLVIKPAVAAEVRLVRALRVVYDGEPWEPPAAPARTRTRRAPPTTEGLMQLATSGPPEGMDAASIGIRGRAILAAGLAVLVVGVWWVAWDRAEMAVAVPALSDDFLPGLAVDLPARDEWRGPSAVSVAPGSSTITRAALYQRRGHRGDGRRRDMLILSRQRAKPGTAMLSLDWLASHARATLFTLRGMTVDAATCRPAGLRSERDLRCEGSGHWGGRDIELDQVSWKAANGDLLQATWITHGPRAAIAADLERAARSVTDLE
jgi:hypothetical protein